jgi:hypothetical protein
MTELLHSQNWEEVSYSLHHHLQLASIEMSNITSEVASVISVV